MNQEYFKKLELLYETRDEIKRLEQQNKTENKKLGKEIKELYYVFYLIFSDLILNEEKYKNG